ncbi:urease subunit beta [Curvibacter sp. RS43]|uniref:urease subunit beta n=1 Tax=Curvibacter microcysteis TaxID=3026419 RepID=UPI00235EAA86|nr:urease subunit beta [Curvibacter sp. RS43]MDD0812368.1 urease subunit beta [Curvibacter sp. RS43]
MNTPQDPLQNCPVGGVILASGDLEMNPGRPVTTLKVRNTGDRPVQIGSHFHFFEVNGDLDFDRAQAFGKRLDIPATTAVRFEPGDEKTVNLVPYAGSERVIGFNNLVDGWVGNELDHPYRPRLALAMHRLQLAGFKNTPDA